MKKLLNIFPGPRFYLLFAAFIPLFALAFGWPWLLWPAKVLLSLAIAAAAADVLLLLTSGIRLKVIRVVPEILSLGHRHEIRLRIHNEGNLNVNIKIIDELPVQVQIRDFGMNCRVHANKLTEVLYLFRPISRGIYSFGLVNLEVSGPLGLLSIRLKGGSEQNVAVYPSIMEMKQLEMSTFSTLINTGGIRKIRRLGHSYVFEQIQEYTRGDEFRSINWKATGRRGKLMVNQYEDERSQQIIQVLDRSRSMRLPFNGLTLLDYAVNSALAISNIALRKHDKAGLLIFSSSKLQYIAPESRRSQMTRLLDALYHIEESRLDSGFELLYSGIRKSLSRRSLLFLYTNFESVYSLERALPVLRKVNKLHLLVVVFFENTEVLALAQEPADNLEGMYMQSVAQKYQGEKLQLQQILKQHGIQSIYTKPENLSVAVANKYLELKSRGLI